MSALAGFAGSDESQHRGSAALLKPLLAVGLLILTACDAPPPPEGAKNLLLISVDTLRPDHLGCYGGRADLSPAIDELAAAGALFEDAMATSPWTLPSHTSLFTSMLPFDHHVRWSWMRIAPDHAMLAEHFRAAGYRTAAFTGGGYVAGHFGFNQGFEIYEDHDEIEEGGGG